MSEQAPQQHDSYNPIQDRLAAFDTLKEKVDTARATEAYYDSLIGDAGTETGDLSPTGKQRLQDAAVYDAHQQDLANRTDEFEFDMLQATAGDQVEISNDEYKAAYEALADKFATDPKWRRADLMSKRINSLSGEADALRDQGETEKARAASTSRDVTEHALTDLLAQYAKEPGFNQAVADYLLDRNDVATLDRAAFSALAELAAPTSSEADSASDDEQDDADAAAKLADLANRNKPQGGESSSEPSADDETDDADAAAKLADLAARHNPPETDTNGNEPSGNDAEQDDAAAAAALADLARTRTAPSAAGDTAPAASVTPDTAPQPMTREDRERRINASPLARQIALELAHAAAVPAGIDPERGGNNRERRNHLENAGRLLVVYRHGDDNGRLSEQPDQELVDYFAQQLFGGNTTASTESARPSSPDTATSPTPAGPAGGNGAPSVIDTVRAINAGSETLYLGSDDAEAAAALADLARNHPPRTERATNTLKNARERAKNVHERVRNTSDSLTERALRRWHAFFGVKHDEFVDFPDIDNKQPSRRSRAFGAAALATTGILAGGIIFPR